MPFSRNDARRAAVVAAGRSGRQAHARPIGAGRWCSLGLRHRARGCPQRCSPPSLQMHGMRGASTSHCTTARAYSADGAPARARYSVLPVAAGWLAGRRAGGRAGKRATADGRVTHRVLGLLVLVALARKAHAHALRDVADALGPHELVQLGLHAHVRGGVHHRAGELLDLRDGALRLLLEGDAVAQLVEVDGHVQRLGLLLGLFLRLRGRGSR